MECVSELLFSSLMVQFTVCLPVQHELAPNTMFFPDPNTSPAVAAHETVAEPEISAFMFVTFPIAMVSLSALRLLNVNIFAPLVLVLFFFLQASNNTKQRATNKKYVLAFFMSLLPSKITKNQQLEQ